MMAVRINPDTHALRFKIKITTAQSELAKELRNRLNDVQFKPSLFGLLKVSDLGAGQFLQIANSDQIGVSGVTLTSSYTSSFLAAIGLVLVSLLAAFQAAAQRVLELAEGGRINIDATLSAAEARRARESASLVGHDRL